MPKPPIQSSAAPNRRRHIKPHRLHYFSLNVPQSLVKIRIQKNDGPKLWQRPSMSRFCVPSRGLGPARFLAVRCAAKGGGPGIRKR